jgi:hypothetical protein
MILLIPSKLLIYRGSRKGRGLADAGIEQPWTTNGSRGACGPLSSLVRPKASEIWLLHRKI